MQNNHWAENLEVGDRVTATIRHDSDGQLNVFDAPVIIIENHPLKKYCRCAWDNQLIDLFYNELNQPTP